MKKLSKFLTVSLVAGSLLSACGTGVDPNVTDDIDEVDPEGETEPTMEETPDEGTEGEGTN